ncbi:hypothetical protein JTE90_012482 [Oedothorax gibbosus]|uniref:Uncharacterized protein n=1 Tax=Oedothorax gibbosus TaxID=931172 RepID=A0AAV6TF06_9ARAC|nr:hypothetical protein JTE90_012482 [Oedothorax gibbosus]
MTRGFSPWNLRGWGRTGTKINYSLNFKGAQNKAHRTRKRRGLLENRSLSPDDRLGPNSYKKVTPPRGSSVTLRVRLRYRTWSRRTISVSGVGEY